MRHVGQGLNVANLGQGIGGRFGKQQTGVGLDGRLPFSHIGLRNKRGFHTKLGKLTANQFDGGAKQGVGANDMVATFEQAQAHQQDGRHAGRSRNASLRTF